MIWVSRDRLPRKHFVTLWDGIGINAIQVIKLSLISLGIFLLSMREHRSIRCYRLRMLINSWDIPLLVSTLAVICIFRLRKENSLNTLTTSVTFYSSRRLWRISDMLDYCTLKRYHEDLGLSIEDRTDITWVCQQVEQHSHQRQISDKISSTLMMLSAASTLSNDIGLNAH